MTVQATDVASRILKVGPNSKPQAAFFAASEYEVLYGGAAGAGKSMAAVLDPLRYINYSGYIAGIFRRSYPELEGSIIPLTQQYYSAAGGRYNEQKKIWTWPSGAMVRLGFLQHDEDWKNHQGSEMTAQYFDEATNIKFRNIEMLAVWNRSRAEGIAPYRRFMTNPGGVSHTQIKDYFVRTCPPEPDGPPILSKLAGIMWQPMKPGPTFWHTDPTTKQKLSRKFIPARVFDNEDLLRLNPNYLAQLMKMPIHRRRAYLEGDWDVFEGQFFDVRQDVHVIRGINMADIARSNWHIQSAIDYGSTTVCLVGYRDHEGNIVVFHEVKSEGQAPSDRANAIADSFMEKGLAKIPMVYDTNMDINLKDYIGYDKTPAAIWREVFQQKMAENAPRMYVISKSSPDKRGYRIASNEAIKEFLRYEFASDGTLKTRPRLFITPSCKYLLQTMPELTHDPDSYEGLDFDQGSGEDHAVDALRYLLMGLQKPGASRGEVKPVSHQEFMDRAFKKIHGRLHRKVRRF